jgi:MFS family permease
VAIALPAFRSLTPPGTLRIAAGMPAAVLLRGLLTFAFFAADAFVPLALHDWRGTSATVAGFALTAATLAWTAGAWIQARHYETWGSRRLVAWGFTTVVVGVAGFAAVLDPRVPIPIAIVAWSIAGLGMGFAYSTLTLVVLAEAPPNEAGRASSGLQLSDVLGTALGTGIGGAILAFVAASGGGLDAGLAGTFGLGLGLAALGVLLARRLPGPTGAGGRVAEAVR